MQRLRYYILWMMICIVLGACSEDTELPERDVHFCVRAEWREGRSTARTRAVSDEYKNVLLSSGQADIDIPVADYPENINVAVSDGTTLTLTKRNSPCTDHSGYIFYSNPAKFSNINNLTFTATATLDGETLSGTSSIVDGHVQFYLHHTKAILRFAFKVAEKYDQVRFIKITQVVLNGITCTLADKVLSKTDMQLIAYGYIDPTIVNTDSENTLTCKYDIFDKDGVTPELLVRTDEATNAFKLGSTSITSIRAGYYYDLNVTLNPDYLEVLSDHDNKHITID